MEHTVAHFVEVPCYMSQVRGFDSFEFFMHLILLAALWP